jgi:PAS domain S-box-containing protein
MQAAHLNVFSPRVIRSGIFGFLIVYFIWVLFQDGSNPVQAMLGAMSLLFTSLVAFSLALWIRSQSIPALLRRAWTWLAVGMGLWVGGDCLYLIRALFFNFLPVFFPFQVAANFLGSLAILAGIMLYPRSQRTSTSRLRLLLDMTVSTAAMLTLVWLIFLQPTFLLLSNDPNGLLTSLPASSDLILLLILMNLFFLTDPVAFPAPFFWIGFGFSAFLFSDLAYAYQQAQSSYLPGSMIDLGWVSGDLMIAFAALAEPRSPRSDQTGWISRILARVQSLLPLVAVLTLGWYAIFNWQVSGSTNPLALWMTVLLSLGLITRQGIVAGEVEFQKYADLVNSIAEPTFICDRGGRLVLVNPALLEAVGETDSHRLLEQPLGVLVKAAEDARSLVLAGARQGWSGEATLARKDGSALPVSLALRPVRRGAGERLVVAGTAHDLSVQKRQQAALQAAYEQIAAAHTQVSELNQQLEVKVAEKTVDLSTALRQLEEQNLALQQLDRLKSDFVSLVSHELRAPLTNVAGGIELLLSAQQKLPGSTIHTLNLVQAEILRLARFVETILDISALDAGRMPIYPEPVDAALIIHLVQQQSRHLPGIERVVWNVADTLPPVLADERALTSVLFHLLDNALKYAPEGQIQVNAQAVQNGVTIQVVDQGPGIPEEALPLLFTRFFRAQSGDSQVIYGHGLGLYIVRRLIEAMHGEITVQNQPGGGASGGACFTCTLPLASS